MSFVDHLEELRWHLVRSASAIFVFSIAAFVAKDFVFHDIILAPSRTDFWTYRMMCRWGEAVNSAALCIDSLPFVLQSRQVTGQFTMHLSSSLVIGLICAFPYAFWEIWRFISPALQDGERNVSRGAVFFVSLLFGLGVMFGYYVVSPLSLNFLSNYQLDPSITNEFDISSYISTISMLVISCGLMFQLPVVVFFLTKVGIATPEAMREYRRIAIVVILVVSAVLTPPDIMSQVLITVPLMILYEISIYVSAIMLRKQRKREAEELADLEAREAKRKALEEKEKEALPLDQRWD